VSSFAASESLAFSSVRRSRFPGGSGPSLGRRRAERDLPTVPASRACKLTKFPTNVSHVLRPRRKVLDDQPAHRRRPAMCPMATRISCGRLLCMLLREIVSVRPGELAPCGLGLRNSRDSSRSCARNVVATVVWPRQGGLFTRARVPESDAPVGAVKKGDGCRRDAVGSRGFGLGIWCP
jgi:hypothetical protein